VLVNTVGYNTVILTLGKNVHVLVNFSIPRFQKESVFVEDQWIVYCFKILTSNCADFLSCGV
jgi:hypothetical protein